MEPAQNSRCATPKERSGQRSWGLRPGLRPQLLVFYGRLGIQPTRIIFSPICGSRACLRASTEDEILPVAAAMFLMFDCNAILPITSTAETGTGVITRSMARVKLTDCAS